MQLQGSMIALELDEVVFKFIYVCGSARLTGDVQLSQKEEAVDFQNDNQNHDSQNYELQLSQITMIIEICWFPFLLMVIHYHFITEYMGNSRQLFPRLYVN